MERSTEGNHRYLTAIEEEGYYVVSADIEYLLGRWAAVRGFALPPPSVFEELRRAMQLQLEKFFPRVLVVKEAGLRRMIHECVNGASGHSMISADRVYSPRGCLHLELSRLTSENMEPAGQGSRDSRSVSEQLQDLGDRAIGPITFVDDVIFSGESACELLEAMHLHGLGVGRVIAAISTREAVGKIHKHYPGIEVLSVLHFPHGVIDEVCERDFYAGVPLSGRLVGRDGVALVPERGFPYFGPFADREHVHKWSSVPLEHVDEWSRFCLSQSIALWEAVEDASGRVVRCDDLERRPFSISADSARFVDQLRAVADSVPV